MNIDTEKWYDDDEVLELIKDSFVLVDEDGYERTADQVAEEFLWAIDSNGHQVSDDWYIREMNEWLEHFTSGSIRVTDVKYGHRKSDDMFEWKLARI